MFIIDQILLLYFYYMQGSAKVIGSKILNDRQSIKTYVSANNTVFNNKITLINSKDYSRIKQLDIFESTNHPNPHIFYFHAVKYRSADRRDVEEYIIKELHHFYSNYQCSYAIAYIHSGIFDFLAFRKFIEGWPEHFFHKLRRIYIVSPSFVVKIVQTLSFGTFSRLCDQLFLNVGDMEQLKEIDRDIMSSIGQNPKTPTGYKNSIAIIQNDLYGKQLLQYDMLAGKYPIIILRLLARLLRNPEDLRLEGIFRKSCNSEELQKLEQQLKIKNWKAIDEEEDILVICGCLKKILHNLKLPLFNYKIYDKVIEYGGEQEVAFAKSILKQMDYLNHKLFILLIVFMTDFIVRQQEYNKMNAYNLSVVFGPCLFRPKEYQLKDLLNSGKIAKILLICFEKQQQIIEEAERKLAQGLLRQLIEGKLNLNIPE